VDRLFDYIFNEVIQSNGDAIRMHYLEKENEVQEITKEIQSIIQKIIALTNEEVLKKLEIRIEELERKKTLLEDNLKNKDTEAFDII
jgi:predicted  nucleic acid-binding Zn-ribbon protein